MNRSRQNWKELPVIKLSSRLRPGVECAPWVIKEVEKLEQSQEPAYENIEEYEEIVGFKVNESFRAGWAMARFKMDTIKTWQKNSKTKGDNHGE